MTSRTGQFATEITHAFPDRPFSVEFWDGTQVSATNGDHPTFRVRSPKAIAHLIRAPGQLGLGRAYVSGELEVDDLDAAIELIPHWKPPSFSLKTWGRLLASAIRACGVMVPPRVPSIELRRQSGPLHSLLRDRAAVRYHYDIGNDFFKLFLDESMTYSCAIFSRGAKTLEEAQETKLDLVCTKLVLKPGDLVLDVGCGWGSFALHAAKNYGARVLGITLAKEQAKLARERIVAAGLETQIEIRVADYRELAEAPFDAISSIGMVEHVGESQIDRYASQLASMLKRGGRLLNHGISRLDSSVAHRTSPITQRYVFPDGNTLPLSRVQNALERAGLVTEHVEGFPTDYAETLRHWAKRFDSHYDEAVRIAGAERARMFRLYLRAARRRFETGASSVYQTRCIKP